MKVMCVNCGYVINRDKIIEGQMVEEYKNIYGTHCPKCKVFNEPAFEEKELTEQETKIALLKEQVKNKLRNKLGR